MRDNKVKGRKSSKWSEFPNIESRIPKYGAKLPDLKARSQTTDFEANPSFSSLFTWCPHTLAIKVGVQVCCGPDYVLYRPTWLR